MEPRKRCLSSPLHEVRARRRRLRSGGEGNYMEVDGSAADPTEAETNATLLQTWPCHYDADVSDCGDSDEENAAGGSGARHRPLRDEQELQRVRDCSIQTDISFVNGYDLQSAVSIVMQMAEEDKKKENIPATYRQHSFLPSEDGSDAESRYSTEMSFSWDAGAGPARAVAVAGALDGCEVLGKLGLASPGLSPIRDSDCCRTPAKDAASPQSRASTAPRKTLNFSALSRWHLDCDFKWRYRKLYPGSLAPSSSDALGSVLSHPGRSTPPRRRPPVRPPSPSPSVAQLPPPLPVAKSMDSFRQFNDSVQDVWSTEDPEEVDSVQPEQDVDRNQAANELNGMRAGRNPASNRYSSEHLRAKGLQRLAMQSQSGMASSTGKAIRPGVAVAVRSLSMGFPLSPSLSTEPPPEYPLDVLPRHSQKADKFRKLLAEKAIDMEELRKLSWSGIPLELRGRVWRILCGVAPPLGDARKVAEALGRRRDEYASLVSEYYPKREDEQYKDTFRQIHIDVPRMCPLVPLFQQTLVQELFERVLFIWALRNPASGYVQGINDLVTPYFTVFLRDYVAPGISSAALEDYPLATLPASALRELEADSFWCLCKLLSSIQNNYTFAQPGIQQRVLQLKDLVQRVDTELHKHLERCQVEYLQFSFRWMNNLLIRELPLACVVRLWDSYHSEVDGFASFHVYVCCSFLLWWSEDLRQQADFQHSLLLLQNLPTQHWADDEIERLLARAFMLKYAFADAPRHLKST